MGEQLIGQDREDRLLMAALAAEAVHHADSSRPIGVGKRGKLVDDRQIFVDQQTLVHDVDRYSVAIKPSVVEFKLVGRTNDGRVAGIFEIFFEKLELFLRWKV